jgi:hypothetical protein
VTTLMKAEVRFFADLVTLTFREALNVRHLVLEGKLEKAHFRMLIDALPHGRDDAWREIQSIRVKAWEAETAEAAETVFRRRFKLSLEDLMQLFSSPHWVGSYLGGNRWAEIGEAVIALREAIDKRDHKRIAELKVSLPRMAHNTGKVADKLTSLNDALF